MSDITDKIREKNRTIIKPYYETTSAINEIPVSYNEVGRLVKDINLVQREFERMLNKEKAKGLQKVLYESYDAAMKIAGIEKREYSQLELFDKQIENVNLLNQILLVAQNTCHQKYPLDNDPQLVLHS